MGLTYDPKPEFIEELIEKGSSQFLDAMSNLLAFAAGYEAAGGKVGSADLLTKLGSAARLQKRSVETYENLLSSIADLKIAKKTSEILSQMTSAKNMSALLDKTIGHSSMDMVIEAARSGDPKRPIEEFTNLLRNLSNRLSKLLTISEANKATPTDVQEVISLGIETYLYGQSIARFNKLSRAQFAKD